MGAGIEMDVPMGSRISDYVAERGNFNILTFGIRVFNGHVRV